MSYSVIRTGGKQYRVKEGDLLRVEKLEGEAGAEVEFGDVLLVEKDGDVIVDPKKLGGLKVRAKIVRHGRGNKVVAFKFKRRKGFHKTIGHRQSFTEVRISSIA